MAAAMWNFSRFIRPSLAPVALAIALAGCSRTDSRGPGEWPQFRGPGGQGIAEATDLPVRWRPNAGNVRWKTQIPGGGDSSPVVSNGRVFLTTAWGQRADDKEKVVVRAHLTRVALAMDLETGEILWETPVFSGRAGKIHWLNTHATPTPAVDGKTVFVSFDAHVAALDYEGNLLWRKDLDPTYTQYAHYGAASSLVLTKKAVILLQDREEGDSPDVGWLAALDKKTGDQLWRVEWKDSCCSYTTPAVIRHGSKEMLIVTTSRKARAYDPETGTMLWEIQHENTQPVPSVSVWNDIVLFPGAIHDALLSAFRLGPSEQEPEFLWATRQAVPDMPSPLVYQGSIFTLTGGGILSRRDPMTGRNLWTHRLSTGGYRAALVAGDGKVYAVNDVGHTTVIDATTPKLKILRENRLGEGSGATPAIAGGSLLIRGKEHLFRIEKRTDGAAKNEQPAA